MDTTTWVVLGAVAVVAALVRLVAVLPRRGADFRAVALSKKHDEPSKSSQRPINTLIVLGSGLASPFNTCPQFWLHGPVHSD
jgi:hypothetical protein